MNKNKEPRSNEQSEEVALNMKLRVACANGQPNYIRQLLALGASASFTPKAKSLSNLMLCLKARTSTANKIACISLLAPLSNVEHQDTASQSAWSLLMSHGGRGGLDMGERRVLAKHLLPWCDLSFEWNHKMTVLTHAIRSLDLEMMEHVIDFYDPVLRIQKSHGALVQAMGVSNDVCSEAKKIGILQFLMKKGFDINTPDAYGSPPLIYAIGAGFKTIVDFLLKEGADPRCTDGSGNSALMRACYCLYGQSATINQLLPVSNLLQRNKKGEDALMILVSRLIYVDFLTPYKDALCYLMEDSDLTAKNTKGESVWDLVKAPPGLPEPEIKQWLTTLQKAKEEVRQLACEIGELPKPSVSKPRL